MYQLVRVGRGTPAIRRSRARSAPQDVELISLVMDNLVRIPGVNWRVGLDPLIGLIPGVGDLVSTFVSLYVIFAAVQHGAPKITVLRMGLNIAFDYVIGSLPLVGDFADAWWKSNRMNLELLRKRATVSAAEARSGRASDWLFVGGIIAVLIVLAIGSFALSIYLLAKLWSGLPS